MEMRVITKSILCYSIGCFRHRTTLVSMDVHPRTILKCTKAFLGYITRLSPLNILECHIDWFGSKYDEGFGKSKPSFTTSQDIYIYISVILVNYNYN